MQNKKIFSISIPNFIEIITVLLSLLICYTFIQDNDKFTFEIYSFFIVGSLLFLWCAIQISKSSRISIFIAFFVLGLLFSLRAQTGIDDGVYMRHFLLAQNSSFLSYLTDNNLEKGFSSLNYFLFILTNGNFNATQFIISEITFIIWGVSFWKLRNNIDIKIAVLFLFTNYYFFFMGHGLVRMFLANAIICYAISSAIEERRPYKFLTCIILATLIHLSAFFMLILLPFSIDSNWIVKNSKKYTIGIVCTCPIFFVLIGLFIIPNLSNKYGGYVLTNSFSRFSLLNLDTFPFLMLAIFLLNRIEEKNRRLMELCVFLLAISSAIKISSHLLPIGRLNWYMNIGLILLISIIKNDRRINITYKSLILVLFISYGFLYLMHTALLSSFLHEYLFPYKSFLQ